jgi:hypothetical protein
LIKLGKGALTREGISSDLFMGLVKVQSGTLHVAKTSTLGSGLLTLRGGTLIIGSFNQNDSLSPLIG